MKTVAFLDLDGTLWEWGLVPDSARAAIAAAQARGHKFLTNTGRARSEVPDLAYLGLDGYCFAAGAEVILDGRTVVDERLGADTVREIAGVFASFGLNYNLEGGDGSWIAVNDERAFAAVHAINEGGVDPIMSVPRVSEMTPEDYGSIHKLFYHGGGDIYEDVAARMPDGVTLTDLGHGFAEATRTGVSKATAMEAVRSYLGPQWRDRKSVV